MAHIVTVRLFTFYTIEILLGPTYLLVYYLLTSLPPTAAANNYDSLRTYQQVQ